MARRNTQTPQTEYAVLEERIEQLEKQVRILSGAQHSTILTSDASKHLDPMQGEVIVNHPGTHVAASATDPVQYYHDGAWRALGAGGGFAIYECKVFFDNEPVVTGDKAFEWEIPEDLDGAVLVKVGTFITTAGGQCQVQLANATTGHDMLSTKATIDAGELNSKDASVQPVVDTSYDAVSYGDHIRVDVDVAGGSGLGLYAVFTPSPIANVALQGYKGDPGGVVGWTGTWTTSTGYTEGEAVSNNGTSYVVIQDHTSGATTEPGVGANWQTYWMVLAEGNRYSSIEVIVNGNGFVVDTGVKGFVRVPFNCTIEEVTMLGDQVGNVVVDIWKDTYANHPPLDDDSITAGNPLTITNDSKTTDTVMTGWTKQINEDDILAFHVDSCSLIQRLTISLKVGR